jgi:hypothetical protein
MVEDVLTCPKCLYGRLIKGICEQCEWGKNSLDWLDYIYRGCDGYN